MHENAKQTLLIVDDAVENLNMLDAMLRAEYRVQAARNGAVALKLANAPEPPDLILLDIVMPDMDGFAVCQELKANAATRDIPVIFISALDDVFDKVQAFRMGGVDFITKPFHVEEVLARVRVHLKVRRLQSELEERNQQLAQALAREKARLTERIQAGLRAGNFAWWEMGLPSGHIVFDDRKAEMLGYAPGQFKTYTDFVRLIHPDDRGKALQAMRDHLEGRAERYEVEYRIQASDGTYKWLRDIGAAAAQDEFSDYKRVIGIVEDITKRKHVEEALYQHIERLRAIRTLDTAILAAETPEHIADVALNYLQRVLPYCGGAVLTLDPDGEHATLLAGHPRGPAPGTRFTVTPTDRERWQQQNGYIIADVTLETAPSVFPAGFQIAGARAYLGIPLEAGGALIGGLVLGAESAGAFTPEHMEIAREVATQIAVGIQQARMREQIQQHTVALEREVAARTADLTRRNIQLQVAAEVARDVSAGGDLDELMRRAVELVQERFGFYHTGLFLIDERREYAVLKAATSQEGRAMLAAGHKLKVGTTGLVGYVAGTGKPRVVLDTDADAQHFRNPYLPHTRSEMALPLQVGERIIGVFDVQSTAANAFDEEDVRILQLMADQLAVAIERTRLFAQIQAALEERLEMVISNVPVIVFALDKEGVYTLLEGKGLAALEIDADAAIGKPVTEVFPNQSEIHAHVRRALGGETFTTHTSIGAHVFESWYAPLRTAEGEISGVSGVCIDVTERRQLEKQIHRQERLAAIGQLAGGIAHDFNNFMTTIIMYASLLLRIKRLPAEALEHAQVIIEESRRAAQLVRQVLDFSRRSFMEVEPVDLLTFIQETVDILRKTLPEHITVTLEASPGAYVVNADPTRIQQAVMNLALNARDAMPEGGQLRIALTNVTAPPHEGDNASAGAGGNWVRLTISDTGTGMTDEVRAHLFEPFFTTKGVNGTGLGLAQVYGIVKQHGGDINVETAVGQGTTFTIDLPAYQSAVELPVEAAGEPALLSEGQGETILFVEDDVQVRKAGLHALEALGYRVLTAPDGETALRLYEDQIREQAIALVITDMVMPGMSGRELLQSLRKLDPAVKTLVLTGYMLQEELLALRAEGFNNVIYKPLDVQTLASMVRRIIGERPIRSEEL
ncbi:MAG: response regulator [Anaerolineae bacterium]